MPKKKKEKPLKVHGSFEELLKASVESNPKDLFKNECKKLARKIEVDLKGHDSKKDAEYFREFRALHSKYCTLISKDKEEFSEPLYVIGSTNAKAEMLEWIKTFYSDLT